jgi:hypothetical protein
VDDEDNIDAVSVEMEPRITTGATNSARKSNRDEYTWEELAKVKEDFLNIEHKLFTESAKNAQITKVSDVVTKATGEPQRTTEG